MMKKKLKLSIILLTYNNWRLLGKALHSIHTQNMDSFEFEIIISDDATPDFDIEYIKGLLCEYNFTDYSKIIVNRNNVGTVKSFNNAIMSSCGDLIVPLAADDYFYDDKVLTDIVDFFIENPDKNIVTGLQVPFDDEMEYEPIIKQEHYELFNCSKKLLTYLILRKNIISGASTYYRREIFSEFGFFDEEYRLLEDLPYYISLLSKNHDIPLLKRKVIKYKLGGVSTSKSINPILEKDMQRAIKLGISNLQLGAFKKRRLTFNKVFNKNEKYRNAISYPEQFIPYILKRLKHRIRELR